MENNIIWAFVFTILAGLSTALGAFLVFIIKSTNIKALSFGLGLSAGVMIYLSFFELLTEASFLITGDNVNSLNHIVILLFVAGMAIAGLIDMFTHHRLESCVPQESAGSVRCESNHKQALLKTGLFTAVIIAVHNFPEGIATFTTTEINLVFGASVALAIAIHNIPEGFCIALPIYGATNSKKQGILYALFAGLSEPLGALFAYWILSPYLNTVVLGWMLAAVAGVMVYIAVDELLPTARKYGGHIGLFGLISGMLLMSLSLFWIQ